MNQRTVYLFAFDSLADWEPGFATAELNNPDIQAQPGRFRLRAVGESAEPATTMGGLRILPDLTLDELEPDPDDAALLILPGGDWDGTNHLGAIEKARAFLAAGIPVAAICGATYALASAGLLDDRDHTGNAARHLAASGYRGAAHYRDEPAVTDGNLITAGGTAPLEFAYHIFVRLGGYDPDSLREWYALFKTGDATAYDRLKDVSPAAAG